MAMRGRRRRRESVMTMTLPESPPPATPSGRSRRPSRRSHNSAAIRHIGAIVPPVRRRARSGLMKPPRAGAGTDPGAAFVEAIGKEQNGHVRQRQQVDFRRRIRESAFVKVMVVGFLMIVMLIPSP